MTNRIFISYETTTGLNLAKHLSASLIKLNFLSFIAERDIKKGEDWQTSIDIALLNSEIFILITTNLALKSDEVIREVNQAVDQNKEIVPCKKNNVNDIAFDKAFPKINKLQRIDFKDEFELSDAVIESLINREVKNQNEVKLSISYSNLMMLGRGQLGETYKAIRLSDKEPVILKIITADQNGIKTIVNSASVWLQLKHKNIVELTGINFSPILYIEQEYCDKSFSYLDLPLSLYDASKVLIKLCNALEYTHDLGFVHGDLKPDNILFQNNEPKISDWGSSVNTHNVRPDGIILTPFYASPEQLKFEKIDMRSDLYQLGLLFFEMLTNTKPNRFNHEITDDFKTMAIPSALSDYVNITTKRSEIEPPSKLNKNAERADNIILKLLKENKNERYQSVRELKSDLEKMLV